MKSKRDFQLYPEQRFPVDPPAPKQCAVARTEVNAMNEAKYTGHVGEGGLQGHSVGALYPYIVYGRETPCGLRYGVMHASNGFDSGARFIACADAYEAADYAKRGDNA